MTPERGRPQTPQALRRSLNARLTAEARRRGVAPTLVRKQYVFALLFRRMFGKDSGQWMVLGGNALLLRTGGGRFTQDIDLSRADAWSDEEALLEELREIAGREVGDRFRFEITHADPHAHTDQYGYGTKTVKIHAKAYLGASEFEPFTIDVSVRRHITGAIDYITPTPVINHETLHDLPEVPVVPIENHLADKICGIYELHHGGKPSTRYRDLADIVRIIRDLEISAGRLTEMLRHEQGRRRLTLPKAMEPPADTWVSLYPAAAENFAEFPAEFHPLNESLRRAGECLNAVLTGARTRGLWDPMTRTWAEPDQDPSDDSS